MSNLKTLTKTQLIVLVQERNAEVMDLRQKLGDVKHDLARVAPGRVVIKFADGRPARNLPAHFAAARAAAMSSGKCVAVAIN